MKKSRRGCRFAGLRAHGIVLEELESGQQTKSRVKDVAMMPRDEPYGGCLVPIQATQAAVALPTLVGHQTIASFLFIHDTLQGFDDLIAAPRT